MVFGVGTWLWLRQWTTEFWATVLSVLVMISEPSLFSAFNYSGLMGLVRVMLLSSWLLLNHPSLDGCGCLSQFYCGFLKSLLFYLALF